MVQNRQLYRIEECRSIPGDCVLSIALEHLALRSTSEDLQYWSKREEGGQTGQNARRVAGDTVRGEEDASDGSCLSTPGHHPECESWANLKSISQRCHPILVALVWNLTKETMMLPLGCLQGGKQVN